MRIMERLGLLVRADAHGVMDRLEERSLLVKQHLREAELELERKRARLEAMDDEARHLEEAAERAASEVEALDRDVELALAQSEEELARFAVRRLLPRRAALAALRARSGELASARERLEARLREQQGELDELRLRARARLAELEREGDGALGAASADAPVADEEIDFELLRRRQAGRPAVGGKPS